ncbi:hypothetical protein BKA56DRAFT_667088 [Ilyonectria sp. MPI-CAGE-AT-0026]|nr:hypothetical protein BKA56DRAFT_667088 [Ilyonectria sp. MPI-CAGE-AT-0026]
MATQNSQNKLPAAFTPEMRDRQARGKDPYFKDETSEDSDSSDDDPLTLGLGAPIIESFADRERKGEAISVLDHPETLMAHAQANDDSISGQRQRFMRQLCGIEQKPRSGRGKSAGAGRNKNRRVNDRGGR